MKASKILAITLLLGVILMAKQAMACEIEFKITSETKQEYKIGDEIVVEVFVKFTHRNCPEGIDATKFDFTGVKALGATKWKEVSEGNFERKFKLQVTENGKGKHLFNATRTCDKDGGAGSIKFEAK